MQIPLNVLERIKKTFYIGNLRGFLLHTVSSSSSLSRKRFFLSLYIKGKEPILDKKIFLGLLERNDSTLINKKLSNIHWSSNRNLKASCF